MSRFRTTGVGSSVPAPLKRSLMFWAAVGTLAMARAGHAEYVWDPDRTGGLPANGGSGSWTTAGVWYDESTANYTTWPAVGLEALARFEGTGGLVTVSSPVQTNGVIFASHGYAVSGAGPLRLVGPSGVFPVPVLSISDPAHIATINTVLTGDLGFFKGGGGTIVLAGANTFTGTLVVSEGAVGFSANSHLGAGANVVDLYAGALRYIAAGSQTVDRTINGLGGAIDVAQATGNLTTTGVINGKLTKVGAGTLTLASTTSTISTIEASGGTLAIADRIRGNAVTIAAGAQVRLNAGTATSDTGSLTIAGASDAWTGKLDVTDSALVRHTTGGVARASAYATTLNQARSGLAEAGGVFWTGNGIMSSSAASESGGLLTAVGVILNDFFAAKLPAGPIYTIFEGAVVNQNDILIKYTYFGDADLNGVVNGADYFLIDQAFSARTLNGGWLNGDFNYDGKVDGTDYYLIDNAFGAQGAPLNGASGIAAAVPEPSLLGVLLGAVGLLGRRRTERFSRISIQSALC